MTIFPASRTRANWRGFATDTFGLVFAAFWASRGAKAALMQPALFVAILAVPTLLLLACFVRRDIIRRDPERTVDKALMHRAKIVRVVLIFAASFWANGTHHLAMFLPLLGGIIGLSYVMIGRAMAEPVHRVMGVGIVLVSGLSFLLPEPLHLEIAGFGTAACVWIGSAARLWRSEPRRAGSAIAAS